MMHEIIVDGLHVWCGDQFLEGLDQAMKQYYKENMTKRKNKPTGIEAMAGESTSVPTTGFNSIEEMDDTTWIKKEVSPEGDVKVEFVGELAGIDKPEESPNIESFTYSGSDGDIDVKWIKNPVLDQIETMKAGIAQAEVNNESTPYTRLLAEEKELRQKVEKLQKFLRDPFKAKLTVNEEHFNLLVKQYGYMGSYLEILTKRIQLFN